LIVAALSMKTGAAWAAAALNLVVCGGAIAISVQERNVAQYGMCNCVLEI
jgi:hypothetical protein